MRKLLSIVLATAMLICSLSVAASAKVYDYEISLGQTLEVAVSPVTERTVKFAPEHDSVFILEAESEDLDTYCWLFAAETDEELQISDDENGSDFRLEGTGGFHARREDRAGRLYPYGQRFGQFCGMYRGWSVGGKCTGRGYL